MVLVAWGELMANGPAYLKDLKAYDAGEPTVADLAAMEKEFYAEGDRACGILMGSLVENALETAITQIMRRGVSRSDIFGFNGPAGSFSAKITLAYGLGIYRSKTKHDLNLIRELRNKFAHCRRPIRFETDVTKAVCDHLRLPDIDLKSIQIRDSNDPKERFIVTCQKITFHLLHFAHTARPYQQASQLP